MAPSRTQNLVHCPLNHLYSCAFLEFWAGWTTGTLRGHRDDTAEWIDERNGAKKERGVGRLVRVEFQVAISMKNQKKFDEII
jgi:hypothetical protein